MRIRITTPTLTEHRWHPIFDVILLLIEEGRHSIDVAALRTILDSDWLRQRPRSDRELLQHSATSRSHDRLIDRSAVVIDQDCQRGGRAREDALETTVHPMDAIVFLSLPFSVLVENEWYDGAFLLWMARAVGFEKFVTAYRSGRFVFRHAGGKNAMARSAAVISRGVWPRSDGAHSRALRMWASAVLDNDGKYPGDTPNAQIVQEIANHVAAVHQLEKRSIESYLPHTALRRYDRSGQFKRRVDALFRLSADQRRYYHMKDGFRLRDNSAPAKSTYMQDQSVSQGEKALFSTVAETDWPKLSAGFGGGLSAIYVEEAFRPLAEDGLALDSIDRVELRRVLEQLYQRF